MKLSIYSNGRDNNFNLIRIIAALAVLVTHSFAIVLGSGEAEPFRKTINMTMGSIAVDLFFIASGFLVSASIINRKSIIEFFWARFLRIFPGLVMMLLITVFGIGTYFTTLSTADYLTHPKTYYYLVKGMTLIRDVVYTLPGVFEFTPIKQVVNGSLWSLPVEIKMYILLAILWLCVRFFKPHHLKFFKTIIISGWLGSASLLLWKHFYLTSDTTHLHLFFMFFTGASFFVLKERISLTTNGFFICMATLVASIFISQHAFFVTYCLTLAYILFYIAYKPAGNIRQYNRLGDYSYGVYIYAYPVQQSIATLMPNITITGMIIISIMITILLATLSWHFIEHPSLAHKNYWVNQTKLIVDKSIKKIFNLQKT